MTRHFYADQRAAEAADVVHKERTGHKMQRLSCGLSYCTRCTSMLVCFCGASRASLSSTSHSHSHNSVVSGCPGPHTCQSGCVGRCTQ